ncbi:MAG TPA: ATP-binding protein [Candidatus Dormibacteraeota bacterium]|nr:ATP-binding protein [Candidatus Dormibacteraeota bacterium]
MTEEPRLYLRRGRVTLEIQDSGKGIPAELLEETCKDWLGAQGMGLRGMRERMRQLSGELRIMSDKYGTQVRAVVPIETAAAASC